ncbi:glyoxalase/bleomycin resistance/dioxygenase family protein [Dehalogenimonas formicexedens]|uniref:Glyoxalase/bleomycin resistance/dioxygenase family protein n=1 Tax=Dehalogenimonas formicexedens TaxID=1839801 RepID=A0A1P8F4Q5_9CHLR|nr:VOC family protein [Dehalogenimonas formicexedens]APV43456.1 glyoxalase/bleomycin resistance/dioxygenase family protein [Dehalogenimonas formicexedens]
MLSDKMAYAVLPAVDLKRARKFWEDTIGLKVMLDEPAQGMMVMAGEGSMFYVYQRGATKADHTVLEFKVDNIDAEMRDLRSKGVKFEEYDIPAMGIKTVNGVATMDSGDNMSKGAWFKDTEGNIIALDQMSKSNLEKASMQNSMMEMAMPKSAMKK